MTRDFMRQVMTPQWRSARWGAVAFGVVMVAGLNLQAVVERSATEAKRLSLQSAVKASFPGAREQDIERDASAVMQRETQALRAQAGKAGSEDLEIMLQAAASAWPGGKPVESFRFEPGKLSLAAQGWKEDQVEKFRSQLQPQGWRVDFAEGRVTLTRAAGGKS